MCTNTCATDVGQTKERNLRQIESVFTLHAGMQEGVT